DHVLTQSMILVRVIPSTKQVTMLSIPRDLYAHLSTGGYGKIDGAYSYGGPGAAVATGSQDFGGHIDDYIWIGFLGPLKLIGALRGGCAVCHPSPGGGRLPPPHDRGAGCAPQHGSAARP